VHFANRADGAGSNQLHHTAKIVGGVDLRSHLGRQVFFSTDLRHQAGFMNRVRQGLLAIAVFAHPHRHDACRCMDMVGRTDEHGIDLLIHGIQHLPEVFVPLGGWERTEGRSGAPFVHVAESYDVLARDGFQVLRTAPTSADDGDVQLFIGRRAGGPSI
jgi:hypothetical protein